MRHVTEEIVEPSFLQASKQVSLDGTRKYLVRIAGGHEVEVVYIPETDRGTLCVSSQVGCTLTCSFCHTGTQKLVRNLTAGEIALGPVLGAIRAAGYRGAVAAEYVPAGRTEDGLAWLPALRAALAEETRA